jgi:hypothetical protein
MGAREGLPVDCAASMDLATIRKAYLVRRIGALDRSRRPDVCEAMVAAIDC